MMQTGLSAACYFATMKPSLSHRQRKMLLRCSLRSSVTWLLDGSRVTWRGLRRRLCDLEQSSCFASYAKA